MLYNNYPFIIYHKKIILKQFTLVLILYYSSYLLIDSHKVVEVYLQK